MSVHYQKQDGVGTFTLDNGRLNLFTMAMHEEFHRLYLQFTHDDTVTVGVLVGEGENFCAGADLNESDTEIKARHNPRWDEMTFLYPRKKPMVAAVNGYCFGEGLAYLMNLCDIRVAGETFLTGAPEINYGMGGMSGFTHMASQMAYVDAAYLSLTGEKIDAQSALLYRLVNEVVSTGETHKRAMAIATKIASHPLVAVQTEMDCLLRSAELSRMDSMLHTIKQYQQQRTLHLANGAAAISDFKSSKK